MKPAGQQIKPKLAVLEGQKKSKTCIFGKGNENQKKSMSHENKFSLITHDKKRKKNLVRF